MRTKRFKTIGGYLRSHGDRLRYGNDPNIDVLAGQRSAINNLLPQLSIAGSIAANEDPLAGVERLLALGGTEPQVKALKECQRWLQNFRVLVSVTTTVVPQSRPADRPVSCRLYGFCRDDDDVCVSMIVDVDEHDLVTRGAGVIAESIAGPEYCFHAASTIDHPVPDAAKNRLFHSDEELWAAVPEMRPRDLRRRAAR